MAALLALPLGLFVSHAEAPTYRDAWGSAVRVVTAPLQWAVTSAVDGLGHVSERYLALIDVRDENVRLREELARLSEDNLALRESLQELTALRRLLAARPDDERVKTVHAQVIAASPSALFRSVRLNRGRDDGLKLGAAVLGHEGVVGRVAALGRSSADVMLLVDAQSSTDVLVQRTRARARVRGRGSDREFSLDAQYLNRTADVAPGDLLVTGGLGRTFPKGIPVGRVTGIERRAFGLYQRAIVEPAVDFSRLEHVLVVLPSGEPLTD